MRKFLFILLIMSCNLCFGQDSDEHRSIDIPEESVDDNGLPTVVFDYNYCKNLYEKILIAQGDTVKLSRLPMLIQEYNDLMMITEYVYCNQSSFPDGANDVLPPQVDIIAKEEFFSY